MAKITYTNKENLNTNPQVPDKNKVSADDMNEIKSVVNGLDDDKFDKANVSNTQSNSQTDTYSCDYINGINLYSTDEINTGKIWIDGKPIYRKVISNITTPSTTNSWVSIGSVSNVNTLINMYGFVIATDGRTLSLNHSEPSAEISTTFKSGNVEMKVILDNWKSRPCYVTLEYTKTSD